MILVQYCDDFTQGGEKVKYQKLGTEIIKPILIRLCHEINNDAAQNQPVEGIIEKYQTIQFILKSIYINAKEQNHVSTVKNILKYSFPFLKTYLGEKAEEVENIIKFID